MCRLHVFFWGASQYLELLSLSIYDLSIRDALLVGLLEAVQLLGCCLPQLHGLQPLLNRKHEMWTANKRISHSKAFLLFMSLKSASLKYNTV